MKTVGIEKTDLDVCVNEAQTGHVIITRKGRPIAMIIGIDEEQSELGRENSFWKLIQERRSQETVSREELERLIETA